MLYGYILAQEILEVKRDGIIFVFIFAG